MGDVCRVVGSVSLGTADYVAPNRSAAKKSTATDVYALGCLLDTKPSPASRPSAVAPTPPPSTPNSKTTHPHCPGLEQVLPKAETQADATQRGCSEGVRGRLPLPEALRDEPGALLFAPAVQHLEV